MPWAVSEGARALMLLCVCVCDTNACVMNPTIAASPLCLTLSIKREHTHTHKATQAPINLGSGTSFAHFPNNPLSLTLSLTLLSRFLRTCLCHVHAQRLTHAQISYETLFSRKRCHDFLRYASATMRLKTLPTKIGQPC